MPWKRQADDSSVSPSSEQRANARNFSYCLFHGVYCPHQHSVDTPVCLPPCRRSYSQAIWLKGSVIVNKFIWLVCGQSRLSVCGIHPVDTHWMNMYMYSTVPEQSGHDKNRAPYSGASRSFCWASIFQWSLAWQASMVENFVDHFTIDWTLG